MSTRACSWMCRIANIASHTRKHADQRRKCVWMQSAAHLASPYPNRTACPTAAAWMRSAAASALPTRLRITLAVMIPDNGLSTSAAL
eukprot:CAMPEP_0181201744 /NCGR_PEP_ID=MMETSP1096-20121128/18467_1 /TAXON_ID=156174 ORGANISM="Chrysochromulina ericina, Strain CCMP281" /NCGR_SAMPLE_ID=MMETSP1096 /ASSEMBLY_ACC=CAM_ASM_000453 /LENGTH=86 /DNA_ID=CAMNT_0023292201 /DNA_START=307 /DNA_END=567 /DNA_ORIENTATION=-